MILWTENPLISRMATLMHMNPRRGRSTLSQRASRWVKGLPKHGLPIPQGDYVPATRHGAFIFTAGMTPRRDGELIRTGRIPRDASPEDYRDAVVLACANAR